MLGGKHNQFKFIFASKNLQTKQDLLTYADAFCLAKWLIKHEAVANGYSCNMIPSEGGSFELTAQMKPYQAL
jgi:hypothetical protein